MVFCWQRLMRYSGGVLDMERRKMKKLISWNVNGFRACLNKGFMDFFEKEDADIFCIQENKMQQEKMTVEIPGYHQFWNCADRKGYSGTTVFSKEAPLSVVYGINGEYNDEGRVITLEFPEFYLMTCYSPNVQRTLDRLGYRMIYEDKLRAYMQELAKAKPVIMCGDLNVAHEEIDLKNPKTNVGNAGFTDEERGKFGELLEAGFVDSFRYLYPDLTDQYTWWSYRMRARERNIGWRIDYFVVSKDYADAIEDSVIYPEIMGSDHCPIGLILKD